MAENVQQQKVKVLFLVFSGKASAIFDSFLLNKSSLLNQIKLTAIEGQWDNGGHTGYLLKWYEEGQLKAFLRNDKVLGDQFKMPPPMGDLKSQIARWASVLWATKDETNATFQDIQLLKSFLGTKTPTAQNCVDALSELMRLISIHSNNQKIQRYISQNEEGLNLLSEFTKYYLDFAARNEYHEHSVGNLFLSFMYCLCYKLHKGNIEGYKNHLEIFFDFLKELNMVPKDVRLEFLVDGRYKLKGTTKDDKLVEGESTFDDYEKYSTPIKPSTYELYEIGDTGKLDPGEEALFDTNLIIIPPGSLTNWMPLLNKFGQIIREKNIPVIWIVNAFTHKSEVDLELQYERLKEELGIKPIILAPTHNPLENLSELSQKYFKKIYADELKKTVDFNKSLDGIPNVYRLLEYTVQEQGGTGIKYNSEQLSNILDRILGELTTETTREMILGKLDQIAEEFNIH